MKVRVVLTVVLLFTFLAVTTPKQAFAQSIDCSLIRIVESWLIDDVGQRPFFVSRVFAKNSWLLFFHVGDEVLLASQTTKYFGPWGEDLEALKTTLRESGFTKNETLSRSQVEVWERRGGNPRGDCFSNGTPQPPALVPMEASQDIPDPNFSVQLNAVLALQAEIVRQAESGVSVSVPGQGTMTTSVPADGGIGQFLLLIAVIVVLFGFATTRRRSHA